MDTHPKGGGLLKIPWGISKSNSFKGKFELKLDISGGNLGSRVGVGKTKKAFPSMEVGMDVFWNNKIV